MILAMATSMSDETSDVDADTGTPQMSAL